MTRPVLMMHGVAVLILVIVIGLGVQLYPSLPDAIPTHWNVEGQADAFSAKSVWSVFGMLGIGAGLVLGVILLQRFTVGNSALVPAERKAYGLTFGYMNLWMAAMFAGIALMGWYNVQPGPLFILVILLGGVPILLIIGLHLPAMMRERKEQTPTDDPSLDPKYWVWGGVFYSNAGDPRTWVPKPPHTGVGMTVNLARPGGRLFIAMIVLVILGTIALTVIAP